MGWGVHDPITDVSVGAGRGALRESCCLLTEAVLLLLTGCEEESVINGGRGACWFSLVGVFDHQWAPSEKLGTGNAGQQPGTLWKEGDV